MKFLKRFDKFLDFHCKRHPLWGTVTVSMVALVLVAILSGTILLLMFFVTHAPLVAILFVVLAFMFGLGCAVAESYDAWKNQ